MKMFWISLGMEAGLPFEFFMSFMVEHGLNDLLRKKSEVLIPLRHWTGQLGSS